MKLTLDKARSFKSIFETMSTSTQTTKELKNNQSVLCSSPGATLRKACLHPVASRSAGSLSPIPGVLSSMSAPEFSGCIT